MAFEATKKGKFRRGKLTISEIIMMNNVSIASSAGEVEYIGLIRTKEDAGAEKFCY